MGGGGKHYPVGTRVDGAWCERSVRDSKDIPSLRHNEATFWTLASWVDFRLLELEYFFQRIWNTAAAPLTLVYLFCVWKFERPEGSPHSCTVRCGHWNSLYYLFGGTPSEARTRLVLYDLYRFGVFCGHSGGLGVSWAGHRHI